MGFRGSRVQIPPSRSSKTKGRHSVSVSAFSRVGAPLLCICYEWARKPLSGTRRLRVASLVRRGDDAENRLAVWHRVAVLEGPEVAPPARRCDINQWHSLPRRGPRATVGMEVTAL